MTRALFLILMLPGCAWFQPEPEVIRFGPRCVDYVALSQAVVDGRWRGQSRMEQRLLVNDAEPYAAVHRAMVESVYDWPRPTTPGDWLILSATTAQAAEARCINRPAQALQGRLIP
ncbi:hypothetical protein SAMN05444004_11225 [Jannaschia faecimaris]|uniref:Uncharacterized protein n=1 Tax=Jannaschia faecimaris TaxID=1244108 RepID=A0A1H3SHD0_9RHOB|nr:hypothetical protein [Jannaschia faecimaris]SDZ37473.1 hypothetical protein SAMN05444004_11225 [Jannaschia faecimaris]